jgi:hypothetical protein
MHDGIHTTRRGSGLILLATFPDFYSLAILSSLLAGCVVFVVFFDVRARADVIY